MIKNIKFLYVIFFLWIALVLYYYFKNHSVYLLLFEIKETVLLDLFLILYLGIISYYSGAAFFRLTRCIIPDDGIIFKLSVNSAAGFGILGTMTFFLGLFGFYSVWFLIIMHFTLLLIALPEILKTLEWAQKPNKINFPQMSFISSLWFFILILMILMRLVTSLTPPYGDDAQWYHLGIPLDYLKAGKFYPIYAKPAGAFPAIFEMINLNCLAISSDISSSFLNFYIGILLIITMHQFIKRFISKNIALPFTVIFYSDPTILFLNTEIKNDQFLALMILLAIYYIFLYFEKNDIKIIKTVGTFLGISLGTKYTSINIVPFIIIALCFIFYRTNKKEWLKYTLFLVLFTSIFSSSWYFKNIIVYKNPLAPFYNNFFLWKSLANAGKSEKIKTEDKNISPEITEKVKVDITRFYGMGRSVKNYLMLPWNLTIHGKRGTSNFDSTVNPLYLAFFPFVFLLWRDKRILFLLFVFAGQFIAWAFQESQNTRYLIPSFPLLVILISFSFEKINTDKFKKYLMFIMYVSTFLFIFAEFLFFVHKDAQPYRFVFFLETRDDYLKRVTAPLYESCSMLKKEWIADKNIRAVFIGTRSNYFFREASIADYNLRRLSEIVAYGKTPEGIKDFLKRERINRVLIEYKMLTFFYSRSEARKEELRTFLEFRNKYLKEIYLKEGLSQIVGLYSISEEPLE